MKNKYVKGSILIGLLAILGIVIVWQALGSRSGVPTGGQSAGTGQQVATALPDPQPMTDIFLPIRQQYEKSVHAQSLQTLNEQRKLPDNHVTANCYTCHSYEYEIAPEGQKPSIDSLTTSMTCGTCHTVDQKGYLVLRSENATENCATCHAATTIKPGAIARHTQSNMYKGVGAVGVPEMPENRYLEGITCADCHMANQNHTFIATLPTQALEDKTITSCYLCHATEDEQKFAKRMDVMQQDLKKKAEDFDTRLKALNGKLAASPASPNYAQAKTATDTVITNLSYIQNDNSWGMHNLNYTNVIMKEIERQLTLAEQLLNQ